MMPWCAPRPIIAIIPRVWPLQIDQHQAGPRREGDQGVRLEMIYWDSWLLWWLVLHWFLNLNVSLTSRFAQLILKWVSHSDCPQVSVSELLLDHVPSDVSPHGWPQDWGLSGSKDSLSPHSHNTKCYLRKCSTLTPSLVIVPTKSPITSDFYKNHFHRKIQLRAIARSQPGLFYFDSRDLRNSPGQWQVSGAILTEKCFDVRNKILPSRW